MISVMGDDKWTYGQYYEWMIDTYFHGHFEEIMILEFLLVKCKSSMNAGMILNFNYELLD